MNDKQKLQKKDFMILSDTCILFLDKRFALIKSKDGRWGIIDKTGKLLWTDSK